MSLDHAYEAVQDWLERTDVRVQRALEPVDGVIEFWAGNAVGRIKWSRTVLTQGAILALLRAEDSAGDERPRQPLLFSLTGYTPGAIAVANSQDVALFSVDRRGDVIPVNDTAVRMDPGPPQPQPELESPSWAVRPEPEAPWITCARCRTTLHPDANFCAACGTDLNAPAPAASGDPVPAPTPGTPHLRCRTCGSHDVELIRPH
jgi:ribosomal protein L37E